jgi:molybdate transport system substrate-binding protein
MTAPTTLHLLCAGAAQGLVTALQARLLDELGAQVGGRFGAVGAMKEAFGAGEPCDLFVSSDAIVAALIAEGLLRPDSRTPLGRVRTGVAVRTGTPHPPVATPEALAAALRTADVVHFPDPERATAGIHFAKVLRELGLQDELHARLRTFPNGATAMRELAASPAANPIGCTQVTEILFTPGVDLVGLLPPQFELATVYTAAVPVRASHPALAARFIEMMTAPDTAALRQRCGFEA